MEQQTSCGGRYLAMMVGAMAACVYASNSPASAQPAQGVSAEQAIATARRSYGPPDPNAECQPAADGEIVVCAGDQDNEKFRVKPTSEIDPESDEALDDGLPRAPDFAKSCKKNPELGPCIGMGWAPPPAYFIKFEDLPDAPEGSDADRISKGELAPD